MNKNSKWIQAPEGRTAQWSHRPLHSNTGHHHLHLEKGGFWSRQVMSGCRVLKPHPSRVTTSQASSLERSQLALRNQSPVWNFPLISWIWSSFKYLHFCTHQLLQSLHVQLVVTCCVIVLPFPLWRQPFPNEGFIYRSNIATIVSSPGCQLANACSFFGSELQYLKTCSHHGL